MLKKKRKGGWKRGEKKKLYGEKREGVTLNLLSIEICYSRRRGLIRSESHHRRDRKRQKNDRRVLTIER